MLDTIYSENPLADVNLHKKMLNPAQEDGKSCTM